MVPRKATIAGRYILIFGHVKLSTLIRRSEPKMKQNNAVQMSKDRDCRLTILFDANDVEQITPMSI